MEYLKIVITIVLAVIGWITAHFFNSKRDLKNKKREIILPFLIKNYQILTHDLAMRELDKNNREEKLEKMISDIQLFGTPKQAELARVLAGTLPQKKIFNLDPLINNLKNELRKELNLPKIKENVVWLRKLNSKK